MAETASGRAKLDSPKTVNQHLSGVRCQRRVHGFGVFIWRTTWKNVHCVAVVLACNMTTTTKRWPQLYVMDAGLRLEIQTTAMQKKSGTNGQERYCPFRRWTSGNRLRLRRRTVAEYCFLRGLSEFMQHSLTRSGIHRSLMLVGMNVAHTRPLPTGCLCQNRQGEPRIRKRG